MDTILYLIEYYDRTQLCRVRYMNNSAFPSRKQAEQEIELLKKSDIKNKQFYGFIKRIRYKIIEHKMKNKI